MIFDDSWRAERNLRRIEASYKRDFAEAKKKKVSQDDVAFLTNEAWSDTRMARDEVYVLMSNRVLRKARALRLPVPSYSNKEAWETGYDPNVTYLSAEAQTELQSAIRKELQERRASWAFWVKDVFGPIASTVIGLLGVIIGLVAVLKKAH